MVVWCGRGVSGAPQVVCKYSLCVPLCQPEELLAMSHKCVKIFSFFSLYVNLIAPLLSHLFLKFNYSPKLLLKTPHWMIRCSFLPILLTTSCQSLRSFPIIFSMPQKASGFDGAPLFVLGNCASVLAPRLVKLSTLSIKMYFYFLLKVCVHSTCC